MRHLAQVIGPGFDTRGPIAERIESMGVAVRPFDSSASTEDQIVDASIVLLRQGSVTASDIRAASRLLLIQGLGMHVYGVDLPAAAARGVAVCAVPAEYNPGQAVAEHALYLMLALAKKGAAGQKSVRDRVIGLPTTSLIAGSTICLVGMGRTGKALVDPLRALGAEVIGIRRTLYPGLAAAMHVTKLGGPSELPTFVGQSDIVSMHLPLDDTTRGIVDDRVIAAMRPGSLLVNTSRAGLIDYDAVSSGVASGRIGGFGTDVWWTEPADPADPLLQSPNVFLTPHQAGFADGARNGVTAIVTANVERVLAGDRPLFDIARTSR